MAQPIAFPVLVDGLATVNLDTKDPSTPLLTVRLVPEYNGVLRGMFLEAPGPDDDVLSCDHASAINNEILLKFMEELSHWDNTGDGNPDWDWLMHLIEGALYRSRETPEVMRRPDDGFFDKLVMWFMPPPPERHIVFSFGELRHRYRWYHYATGIPLLAVVYGLIWLQITLVPWMKYSVISGFIALATAVGISAWVALVAFLVIVYTVQRRSKLPATISQFTHGFFNKAAVYEEQAFREGSENWSLSGRARSCLAFGVIHLANLFYPLATILPLAIGGSIFMYAYLRTFRKLAAEQRVVKGTMHIRRPAVLEAALWHRVYNRAALFAVAIALVVFFGYLGWSFVAAFAVLVVLPGVQLHLRTKRVSTLVPASVQESVVTP